MGDMNCVGSVDAEYIEVLEDRVLSVREYRLIYLECGLARKVTLPTRELQFLIRLQLF